MEGNPLPYAMITLLDPKDSTLLDFGLTNSFGAFEIQLQLQQTKNMNFNYRTSITAPNIEQLQPLINNSDPLNIYVGNPELEAAVLESDLI